MPFIGVIGIFYVRLRNEYKRIRPAHFLLNGTEGLSKQSLHTVTHDAFAVLFSNRYPHPHRFRGTVQNSKRRRKRSLAFLKQSLKIRLFFNSQILHFPWVSRVSVWLRPYGRSIFLNSRPIKFDLLSLVAKNSKSSPSCEGKELFYSFNKMNCKSN